MIICGCSSDELRPLFFMAIASMVTIASIVPIVPIATIAPIKKGCANLHSLLYTF